MAQPDLNAGEPGRRAGADPAARRAARAGADGAGEPTARPGADRTVEPVEEVVYRILWGDARAVALTASPCDPADLAAGHLLALGFAADELRRARYLVTGTEVRVEPPGPAADVGACLREHRPEEGVAHVLRCPDCAALLGRGRAPLPGEAGLRAIMAEILGPAPGVHAVGLAGAEGLELRVEDVGRHSGVDRTLGAAARRGLDLAGLGLATSARVSGEIAFKAARAGVAWIASRSVPTSLALEIAGAAGIPLVARAGSPRARAFP